MTTANGIAIVALACRYPDAVCSGELWRNVLEGRRSFRAMPPERLPLACYQAGHVPASETATPVLAGLISDWRFDRTRFRVPEAAYQATDLAHWLALEIASDAIHAAGGAEIVGRDRTSVIVGNTLTGEFSRANSMRLRLPFLSDALQEALEAERLEAETQRTIVSRFGDLVRERLSAPTEESLAGGLANTIAGRIANHHDFRGGAWTVDGACASSLLAVCEACELLAAETVDAVVVGAVDLSLDPFELIGFSRNGALAREEMRVFDRRVEGFWPGEGCGFAVLMRADDARVKGYEVLAELAGWGISTDGRGGLTRPTVDGQLRAVSAAYGRAGIPSDDLSYLEAHGTGTQIGDPTEIRALARFVGGRATALPVGSIKANLGHTKAAAGFAGLIKAVFALREGVFPPHVGCYDPHPVFAETGHRLAPAGNGGIWPRSRPLVAGVSAFGFGGINAHVVLRARRASRSRGQVPPPARPQDCELLIVSADARATLARELRDRASKVQCMSVAEATDYAAAAAREPHATCRAAVLASRPDELAELLESAARAAETGETLLDPAGCVFVAETTDKQPAIGFLFPGQAAPSRPTAGSWARRFAIAAELVPQMAVDDGTNPVATEVAQPAIMGAALAGMRVLRALRLEAQTALGHSLGELAALVWAGVISEADLLPLARARGAAMARYARAGGTMLRVEAPEAVARKLIDGLALSVACLNAQCETVVSGQACAVPAFAARAEACGIHYTPLPVSHAFHSPDIAPAQEHFARVLDDFAFAHACRIVVSTVSGRPLGGAGDVVDLLRRQLTSPVRFSEALAQVGPCCDLLIEVGPGAGLTRLATQAGYRACSIDAHGPSLRPLCQALALAWTFGAVIDFAPLFADRPTRPPPIKPPTLLTSPCGRWRSAVGALSADTLSAPGGRDKADLGEGRVLPSNDGSQSTLERLRTIVAHECGLPAEAIDAEARLLDDLHLNSLRVGRIVAQLVRDIGASPPLTPTEFANASLAELASTLDEVAALSPTKRAAEARVEGVANWIARYGVDWVPTELPATHQPEITWRVRGRRFAPDDVGSPVLTLDERGPGVLFWVDVEIEEAQLCELWVACQAAAADDSIRALAIVHRDAPLSAFARSLTYEQYFERIILVDLRAEVESDRETLGRLLAAPALGITEFRIDPDGTLSRPVLRPQASAALTLDRHLDRNDVILCTGGARGIGAECALRLAETTGARLLLIGRSSSRHPEVAETLARAEAKALCVHYAEADVTSADQVFRAVREGAALLGPVTGILHAAGVNEPARFTEIDADQLREALAPKVDGLRNSLDAVDVDELRLLVTFGSIVGRLGLAGEAHYALANALETRLVEQIAAAHPNLQAVALEWSVWAGRGMGERHGSLERLAAQGVDALSLESALAEFERIVVHQDAPPRPAIVVTSRFGLPVGLDLGAQSLPLLRFLEETKIYYPGIELVVDARVSLGTDPYLADHRVSGVAVFPGVMALEAMAQVAFALVGRGVLGCATDIEFVRPVTLLDSASITLRIAALSDPDGTVRTAIRSSNDDFGSIRCRARWVRSGDTEAEGLPFEAAPSAGSQHETDAGPLYGPLLFHGTTFQRIERYETLGARDLKFRLRADGAARWFGEYLPQTLVVGDAGAHDALLHGLQAGVPHKRVLPEGIARIRFPARGAAITTVHAHEREATADRFVFDIIARGADGAVVEVWEKAAFRAIDDIDAYRNLPALGACYLERRLGELLGRRDVRIALAIGGDRCVGRRATFAQLGFAEPLYRSDGAPVLRGADGLQASLAHGAAVSLAVVAPVAVACDLEAAGQDDGGATLSPADSRLALAISDRAGEQIGRAELRVWAARECLRKLGIHYGGQLSVQQCSGDEAVVLNGDGATIASIVSPNALLISVAWAEADARGSAAQPYRLVRDGATELEFGQHVGQVGGAA